MADSSKISHDSILKMKKEFSTKWKGSKRPGKRRKYAALAPLHIKKRFVRINLSKELRKKYGKRNLGVRKSDKVKIMTGEFRKKEGKVTNVLLKKGKITVEGIQRKKRDGSKIDVKMDPSNVQIIELDMNDKNREKMLKNKPLEKVSKENKKETNIKQSGSEKK